MYQKEVFRIEYPTGYMNLNVCCFFGTSSQKNIMKALRVARQYCPDSRRLELIDMLRHERDQLKEILDALDDLERKRLELLAPVYSDYAGRPQAAPEKALVQMREKLKWTIDLLSNAKEKERWRG